MWIRVPEKIQADLKVKIRFYLACTREPLKKMLEMLETTPTPKC